MSGISTPSVAMLLVPPVSGGQFAGAVLAVVTTPSHRGEGWGGVCCLLHATRCGKGGGDSREDGDYDVEDFAPGGVVVEGSHFC